MDSFWDFFWFIVSFFLLMAYLMVLFHILGDLLRDRSLSGFNKALWVLALIFLPILAALIYIATRGEGMVSRQQASMEAARSQTDAYIRSVAGSGASPADDIARAQGLLDSGAITPEEFNVLKSKALA